MRQRFLRLLGWNDCVCVATAMLVSLLSPNLRAQNASLLQFTHAIRLPGVEGRIDHFAFDAFGDRLFVCALGNNTVEVVDLRKKEQVHSIRGLGSPQGVAYLPGVERIMVANDNGGICKLYDGKSFQSFSEVSLKDDADNVRYDSDAKEAYVGFGNGGIARINPDGKQVGTIKLVAHPEAFELEKRGRRIFVNVPSAGHVAVVDRNNGQVTATWKTGGVSANFPMALDEANHRLFVGCRMPSKLVTFDTESGEIVSKIDISSDADDVFYDSKRHRIYVICGAGKIDIVEQTDANTYKRVGEIDTAAGARTGFFAPQRDELFVAIPHRASQPAEIRCYRIN
jgi:DNA-binding beta-propeller fold protein YncE